MHQFAALHGFPFRYQAFGQQAWESLILWGSIVQLRFAFEDLERGRDKGSAEVHKSSHVRCRSQARVTYALAPNVQFAVFRKEHVIAPVYLAILDETRLLDENAF